MTIFWMSLALLVIVAGVVIRSRRARPDTMDEPWRASLAEPGDDEPLDIDEIRRAEEEWVLETDPFESDDEEEWS